MRLYIDPGTGSMLFAILIGLIGALNYFLRTWIVKLRFLLSTGKQEKQDAGKIPFAIFSDDKRYWPVFEPICRELDRRGFDVVYLTASENDPALENSYPHVKAECIGGGNKAFARMNFLNATLVLATTPGLDVYQWKRSKDAEYYVHMLHSPNGVLGYRMFGTDYFDAVLLSGKYQIDEIRSLEKRWALPEKETVIIGIPYMDEMAKRLADASAPKKNARTVLLAPSWGPNAIFSKYGGKIIDELLKLDCHIIVRPHPQSFVSEKKLMEKLMSEYPDSERLEWNRDTDNFDVQNRSDIMISDFSGVILEFALIYDKPVIYADAVPDLSIYDYWWSDSPRWAYDVLPRIGEKLLPENLESLGEIIDTCLTDPKYAQGRKEASEEVWKYKGQGAVRAADYLINKYQELTDKEVNG